MKELMSIYLLAMNLIAFGLYGFDKYRAQRHMWRIPENTLITSAMLGGAFGAYLGMQVFRHKTKHIKFKVLIPLLVLAWIAVIGYFYYK